MTEQRSLLGDVLFRAGWSRFSPPGVIAFVPWLTDVPRQPLTANELGDLAFGGSDEGWDSPAWDEPDEFTEEEMAELREMFGSADDEVDAETATREAAERHARKQAESDIYAAALGLAPVRTIGGALEYLVRAGVILAEGEGAERRFSLNPQLPLPEEVLPLSDERRAEEAAHRWHSVHEETAQAIIRLFDPDADERPDMLRTSLQRLATSLDVEVETARHGTLTLLAETGDFSTDADIERIAEHAVFELRVDWAKFASGRIGISCEPEAD